MKTVYYISIDTNERASYTSHKISNTNRGTFVWKRGVSGTNRKVTDTYNAASRMHRAVTGRFHGAFLHDCAVSGTNHKVFPSKSAGSTTSSIAPPRFHGASGTNVRALPPNGKIASECKIL